MGKYLKHWKILASIAIILLLGISILRPVPTLSPENASVVEGTITEISLAGTNDVIIRLKETDQVFYINRGLEGSLDLNRLQSALIDKWVTITFPKYWTALDLQNKWRHVSVLECEEKIIYSEL